MCSDRMGENIAFFTPAGRPLAAAPPLLDKRLMATEDRTVQDRPDRRLLEQFFRELAGRAIDPDWRTNLPGFRHDHDIPWAIEAAAWEALEDAADDEAADKSAKEVSDGGARRTVDAADEASSDAAAPDTMEESADPDPGDHSVDEAA